MQRTTGAAYCSIGAVVLTCLCYTWSWPDDSKLSNTNPQQLRTETLLHWHRVFAFCSLLVHTLAFVSDVVFMSESGTQGNAGRFYLCVRVSLLLASVGSVVAERLAWHRATEQRRRRGREADAFVAARQDAMQLDIADMHNITSKEVSA
ncbi:MAG: hypothetical protein MHM6MM_001735 [Cercozoa sp. M6MM]